MVAKHSPGLELRKRMLDASSTLAVVSPCPIAHDPVLAEHGGDELGDAAVAAIRKYPSVCSAQSLDARASVVNRIVAIACAASGGRDNA